MSADTELRDPARRVPTEAIDDAVVEPRSSRRRDALIVVIALLVGMGAVAGYGALTGDDGPATSATVAPDGELAPVPAAPQPESGADVPPGTPAASPVEAVEAFLKAEADGDFETSYALLTGAQRRTYGSPSAWTNAHADFFPVTDHEVIAEGADRITAEVEYRSSLDEVIGLVPARARVEWVAVQEDGGWLVDFDASVVEPLYPEDADAPVAVARWAEAHQDCREPQQYEGSLVASADLREAAESLCGTTASIGTGDPLPLDEFDATALVSAFGADALGWARAVELRGPVELSVIVAPVEDRWLVVGLLPAT